jgi:hypothetical protein
MQPIMRPHPEQPRQYCLHCLQDIYGQAITVREKISFPGFKNVYSVRYLHEECALQLE